MDNRARDIFVNVLKEESQLVQKWNDNRGTFFSVLEEEIKTFCGAVQKFAKTGEIDALTLGIDLKQSTRQLNIESDQENGSKKSSRRKKLAPITDNIIEPVNEIKIKKEKLSEIHEGSSANTSTSSIASTITDKVENIKLEKDDMPAPTWIPPKKKPKESSVRSTRTKGKKGILRDSDVVPQEIPLTTINLCDTDDSDVENANRNTRSTRTKTKKQNLDTADSDVSNERTRSTRTKTRAKGAEKSLAESEPVEETRSTRTKTIRKAAKVNDEDKTETTETRTETRSTRTKTIRKAKDAEESAVNSGKDDVNEPGKTSKTKNKNNANGHETLTKEKEGSNNDENDNATHTKASKAKAKRHRSNSVEDKVSNQSKKSKSNSPCVNTTAQTVYEDAHSSVGTTQEIPQTQDTTYVAEKSSAIPPVPPVPKPADNRTPPPLNSTVVMEHPKYNIFDEKEPNLFTDDDSLEYNKESRCKTQSPTKKPKAVFSPYQKTAMKKKIEAFEKLQNGSEIPVKTGRTTPLKDTLRTTPMKDKTKVYTPLGSKFLPTSSSTSVISRLYPGQGSNSSINDSAGPKSAQKDMRERQKKLMEREQAQKKKELLLQAQAEAKRKLNEEKQLKAQQQRKMIEAEKLKQLEAHKQKEEKQKQRELEKEEYLQKQRLELEKKRLAQKKKIQEIQAQRKEEFEKPRPVYMTTEPPRLPTADCYDSDDPDYKRVNPPKWCSGEDSKIMQLSMLAAGDKIKNSLFSRHAQTPDLTEIFEGIDTRKLKRTSSREWKKPPRYTMMPNLNETRFSEDDDESD